MTPMLTSSQMNSWMAPSPQGQRGAIKKVVAKRRNEDAVQFAAGLSSAADLETR